MARSSILIIGPEPPPFTGMEIATRALLDELDGAGVLYHRVNTADPHDALARRGQWTMHNITEAVGDLAGAAAVCFPRRVGAVYIPIAQEFPGLIRDMAFIVIAIVSRRPFIVHLHGGSFCTYFDSRSRIVKAILRATIGRAALGIVLTERLRPALACVLPDERIIEVHNGIDFDTESMFESDERHSHVQILFFSSLFPTKGTLVFLEALSLVRRQGIEFRATMAGTWPSEDIKSETITFAMDHGVYDFVEFTGGAYGDEKARLFAKSDIFCMPSFYPPEGQPLVIIEAMAARLPVVATAWRGIADTVVDGETGFLIPEADPVLLAEKIVALIDNVEIRRRMGEAGRVRYEKYFTRRAFGERMLRALEPYLSRNDGGSTEPGRDR